MEHINDLSSQVAPPYKDRSAGLIAFGIIEILIGGLFALFVPLMLLGQVLSAKQTGAEPQYQMLITPVAIYGAAAVILIVLGIGSIRVRRWARALSLIVAWSWLLIGAIAVVFMAIMFPRILNQASPSAGELPAARTIGVIIGLLFFAVFFVGVPAVLVLHPQAVARARRRGRGLSRVEGKTGAFAAFESRTGKFWLSRVGGEELTRMSDPRVDGIGSHPFLEAVEHSIGAPVSHGDAHPLPRLGVARDNAEMVLLSQIQRLELHIYRSQQQMGRCHGGL